MNPVLRVYLFAGAGALFALLWVINVLIRTLRGSEKVSFIDVFLAFTTTVLLLLTLVYNHMGETDPVLPGAQMIVLGVAAVIFVVSVIFALIESRRAQHLRQSRGILGLWAALLVVISSFTVPIVSAQLHYTPGQATLVAANGTPVPSAGGANAGTTPTAFPVNTTVPSPTATETATVTRTPRPTDTPTMTLVGLSDNFSIDNLDALGGTAEATATPTASVTCMVRVNYNLRMRVKPEAEADTITVIPFNNDIQATARSRDLRSWFVSYDGKEGWIDGHYATAGATCDQLPIKDAE